MTRFGSTDQSAPRHDLRPVLGAKGCSSSDPGHSMWPGRRDRPPSSGLATTIVTVLCDSGDRYRSRLQPRLAGRKGARQPRASALDGRRQPDGKYGQRGQPGVVIAEALPELEAELGMEPRASSGAPKQAKLAAEGADCAAATGARSGTSPALQELWRPAAGCFHPQVPPLRRGDQPRRCESLAGCASGRGSHLPGADRARRERQPGPLATGRVMLLLRSCCRCWRCCMGPGAGPMAISAPPTCCESANPRWVARPADFGLTTGLGNDSRAADGRRRLAMPARSWAAAHRPPAAWMDLYSLGVVALSCSVARSPPGLLIQPASPGVGRVDWRLDPRSGRPIETPDQRPTAPGGSARPAMPLEAVQQLPMPESTGPVPRAAATVVLVPPPASGHPGAHQIQLPQPSQQRPSQLRRPSRCRRCWRDRAADTKRGGCPKGTPSGPWW